EDLRALAVVHGDRGRPGERAVAAEHLDAVALELVLDDVAFALHDLIAAEQEVLDRDVGFAAIRLAVQRALPQAGEINHGFAGGLSGNRAGVDRDAANIAAFFDHRDALTQLRGLHGGALSGGSAANHDQIVC